MWAEWYFDLHIPDKDGKKAFDELRQYERQTGETPEELIPPKEFPSSMSYIWSAFWRLHRVRQSGMNGPEAITYTQIKDFMEVTGNILRERDVEALLEIDAAYRKVYYGRH